MDQYDTAALMKALMGQPTGDMKTQARNMALMNAGFAMLNTPGRFSQALGQGGMAGVGAYQGSLEQQRQEAAQRMQLGMQLEDYERKKQVRDLAPKFYRDPAQTALASGGGPTIENARRMESAGPSFDFAGYANALAQYDPQGAIAMQAAMAKDTPFAKIDPKDYTRDSLSKFLESRNFADLVPMRKKDVVNGQAVDLYEAQAGQVFDDVDPNKPFNIKSGQVVPNAPFQQYSISKARAGAARTELVNINRQEDEQSKSYGKTLGEIRSGIATSAFKAPSTMAKLNRIEELLRGVDGGRLAPIGLEVASTANSLGLKIDPNLGNKQAAEALARELAGELREPGTGPMTDKDFENFLQQVPNLSKTAEGRAQIIETSRRKLARDIEIGKLSREYAKRNGGVIDDGFMDVVSDYVAQNPVVVRQSVSGRQDAFPDMSAIEAELARRKGKR